MSGSDSGRGHATSERMGRRALEGGARKVRPSRRMLPLAGFATLVAFLMLVPVSAVPSPPQPIPGANFTPPYLGASGSTFQTQSGGGFFSHCARASVVWKVPPSATPHTGQVAVASTVSAESGHLGGICWVTALSSELFTGPEFRAPASGPNLVSYEWRVSWSVGGSFGSTGVANPGGSAIRLFGNLYDNTNGSWLLGGSSPASHFVTVWDWGLPFNGLFKTFFVNLTARLAAGHEYSMYTGLATETQVFTKTVCIIGCHYADATFTIDVGSFDHGASLLSMKDVYYPYCACIRAPDGSSPPM